MTNLNRRDLLAGVAGGVAVAALPWTARAATALHAPGHPPAARIGVVDDTYFGETLADPYRWMEDSHDPDWLPFLHGQDAYARSELHGLPGRARLLRRIRQLSEDTTYTSRVAQVRGQLFYQQRPAGAETFRLYVRERGGDRLLVDPSALHASGVGHFSLDWWEPSPDGHYVAYGLSKDGSEDSVLHILQVATGHDLAETIPDTEAAGPQWLDDSSGFFYLQLTSPAGSPERYLDGQARFHALGTDPSRDPILMRRGLDPAVSYDRIQLPMIRTFPGASHALLLLADVRPEFRVLTAPVAEVLAGRAAWHEVASFDDEVTDADIHDGDLHLLVNRGTPRGRIVRTSLEHPDLGQAVVAVPESELVIEGISRARDGLYLKLMDGGVHRLRRLRADGQLDSIALPFDGTIRALFTSPDRDGALFPLAGWLAPEAIWSVDRDGRAGDTGLTPRPAIDVSNYETVHAFATAKDGVRVPYSLVHRKGLRRDGTNPTYVSAYGSYGLTPYTPSFVMRLLALVDEGAVVGFANVRGGGEYGRPWHKAGQLENKPNTWRDLIAVCEELIARGFTAREHLAINGRSAGGITVGRALTERPDLFAAVVGGVGWFNPLRYVVEQNGYGEEPEWGAISEERGYRALREIDSYQAVRDGTPYPSCLLTTGVTDPRVAPFHVAKMAARLQVATSSGNPVLLRVDFDAGHGIGSTRSQQDDEAADSYAFVLAHTRGRRGHRNRARSA